VLLALLLLPLAGAHAQRSATQPRSSEFNIFGGYASVQPDYNSSLGNQRNNGFFAGADYNFYGFHHLPFVPSFELRGSLAKGTNVNEGTGLIGPKVQMTFLRRLHPYANFLAGFGDIYFNKQPFYPGYTHDSSVVYSAGGGVDIDLKFHLQAKFDYQYQFWNTYEDPFTPNVLGVGLNFLLPIHTH
jgi:hypothetical protein